VSITGGGDPIVPQDRGAAGSTAEGAPSWQSRFWPRFRLRLRATWSGSLKRYAWHDGGVPGWTGSTAPVTSCGTPCRRRGASAASASLAQGRRRDRGVDSIPCRAGHGWRWSSAV